MTARLLEKKTALVTGAAKRLGKAIALELADAGANVIVHYNSSGDAANETADDLREHGVEAWTVQADLSDSNAAKRLFDDAKVAAGEIDILVNSASIFPTQTLDELTEETLDQNLRVNSLVPFMLGRQLHAQGREAAIVNLLDTRILDYDAQHVPYHLSKRTLFTLTKIMALEFAPRVRVNAVAPGLVLPPPGEGENYLRDMSGSLPLQRHGDAKDVARAVLFLLTSNFVTGQVVYVDGGRHLKANLYD